MPRPLRPLLAALLATAALPALAADDYKPGPDSQEQPGVPKGKITKHSFTSKIFPGTVRDYWVYVPAQYDAATPACVMVVNDGLKRASEWRLPTTFDNLIHKKEMPVTIGIFIAPGVVPAARAGAHARFNRSFEYDGLGDRYARFLLEEMLPEVARSYNLANDGGSRAIAGASSGGIAAFTVAWERPDAFARVFSTIGTFVGLRGGDVYPTLIRKTEPKPIRVYLQDGSNDLDIYGGHWFLANQEMLAALRFSGYQVSHAWGDGGHTGKHGAAIAPEALRWLWRDWGKPIPAGAGSKQPVVEIVSPDAGWQLVGEGYQFTEGPATNARGEVFFSDIPTNRIHKVGLDGNVSLFAENTGGANGLMFGPDGRLYAAQNGRSRIVSYDAAGREKVVATDLKSNDLAIARDGKMYVTNPDDKQVWLVEKNGKKRVVDTGLGFANGVVFTPDQTLLYVSDSRARFVYSYQVRPDGSLAHKQPFCHLHIPDTKTDSGADGMTVDTQGRLYVTTHAGIQFCDQVGRVNGIIAKPEQKFLSNVVFGGPKLDELYITLTDKVYRRKTKATGVHSWQAPILPPVPRL